MFTFSTVGFLFLFIFFFLGGIFILVIFKRKNKRKNNRKNKRKNKRKKKVKIKGKIKGKQNKNSFCLGNILNIKETFPFWISS